MPDSKEQGILELWSGGIVNAVVWILLAAVVLAIWDMVLTSLYPSIYRFIVCPCSFSPWHMMVYVHISPASVCLLLDLPVEVSTDCNLHYSVC